MIAEWDVPFELTTPFGTLPLNQPLDTLTTRRFQLNPEKCSALLPVRSTEDDAPQQDGKIPHRRWRSGYGIHLAIEPITGDPEAGETEPACGADLVEMLDLLGLHLNGIIRTGLVPGAPNARLIWSPSGDADRMLDRCQLAGAPTMNSDGALGGASIEVDIDSAFPYYISVMETDTDIADGGTQTITNGGNIDYLSVWRLYGPFTALTLTNTSVLDLDGNPLLLQYDDTLPGAAAIINGHYLEVDFFRGTAYLDGSGASRKAGFDWRITDLFPLVPGANVITADFIGTGGATKARCLSNDSWA